MHEPGTRVPSMMAPTVVLRDGRPEVALGSAGSNRIRSAILQTILAVVDHGLAAQEAVSRPRIHLEGDEVEAEPGAIRRRCGESSAAASPFAAGPSSTCSSAASKPWPATRRRGALSGGGDPRRGGVAAVVD